MISSKKNVLFLGYSKQQTKIINEIVKRGHSLNQTNKIIQNVKNYDLIISFGYRHILKKEILTSNKKFINLHMSYLPWNKGAHPNFWSFYDSTPKGVSIHLIDEGVDTGPIIYQKIVDFDDDEDTFYKTYVRLKNEIEDLFISKIDLIIEGKYSIISQKGDGTTHKKHQLPKTFKGWNCNIYQELNRIKNKS